MSTPSHRDLAVLERLHALIDEALALSDTQQLHATGIALDTARLSVEDLLGEVRASASAADGVPDRPVRNGAIPFRRG